VEAALKLGISLLQVHHKSPTTPQNIPTNTMSLQHGHVPIQEMFFEEMKKPRSHPMLQVPLQA